jgi:hypothetical protein
MRLPVETIQLLASFIKTVANKRTKDAPPLHMLGTGGVAMYPHLLEARKVIGSDIVDE